MYLKRKSKEITVVYRKYQVKLVIGQNTVIYVLNSISMINHYIFKKYAREDVVSVSIYYIVIYIIFKKLYV